MGGLLMGALLMAAITPFSPQAARATGFLDFTNGWSGASQCADQTSNDCVDIKSATSLDLVSLDQLGSSLIFSSQTAAAPGYTNFSFDYYFQPDPNAFAQKAFYKIGSATYYLDPATEGFITSTDVLLAGQSFAFGVENPGTANATLLSVTNFSYQAVPAPLPLLGAAASFGWIRRRRATLRVAQQPLSPQ